jgi:diadenosine tetraphosphate (Ap4A) HIT family hydrolase
VTSLETECVICAAGRPLDIIADGPRCWTTASARAALPGYVCVVSKTHAVEPFDLPDDEQAAFWLEVSAVARAVRDTVRSPKINYEIHGNTIEHLHVHIFPRYSADPFTNAPIDAASRRFDRSAAELEELSVAIRTALNARSSG